jgi:hypothetical protein
VVATAAALVLLVGLIYGVGQRSRPEPGAVGHGCVVEAGGTVHLDQEQMANAATIAAVGTRLDMPERAVVVAIATALQESKLRNLPHLGAANDHDSIGLFQQRPSQGWGTEEQLLDPRYAAERFYLALSQVPGWERMRLTDAAQRVQRSAFPEAYQQWEKDATVLATALLGRASGAVTCSGVARGRPPRYASTCTATGVTWPRSRWDWTVWDCPSRPATTPPAGGTRTGWSPTPGRSASPGSTSVSWSGA